MARRRNHGRRGAPALLEELEPRLLFSTLTGVTPDQVGEALAATNPTTPEPVVELQTHAETRRELVFVDSRLPDAQRLLSDLRAQQRFEVVELDSERDGIAQVSQALAEHSRIEAIHFITHGSDGAVQLGASWLDTRTLTAQVDAVAKWGQSLEPDADLLFYGCDLAASPRGQAFMDAVAELTGADVAASTDATGNALFGGDWVLEFQHGAIEAGLAPSAAAQASWVGVLDPNAAPVNAVPGAQYTPQDTPLVFSSAAGNAVGTTDPDAGSGLVEVTLSVSNGTLTLDLLPTPTGGETLANTTTAGSQVAPDIAFAPDGSFVVTWQSFNEDGSSWGIYAQRYAASGAALGSQLAVNTTTAGAQSAPVIAVDGSGSFVIAWESANLDGSGQAVVARRFDAAGTPLGGEILVNTTAALDQRNPSLAVDAAGNFVVIWESEDQDGDSFGVFGQRFAASGAALGGEFQVNTTTLDSQTNASVAMNASGSFVVSWDSLNQDGDDWGIYARRFAASGAALGGEIQVNTTTSDYQIRPDLDIDAAGGFVAVWTSNKQDGSQEGVFGRRFDASGAALGGEFQVNTSTGAEQENARIALLASGGFIVVWEDGGSGGASHDVFTQLYDAQGGRIGSEVLVNTSTTGGQLLPVVATNPSGGFAVVWEGRSPADNSGISFQVYGQAPGFSFTAGDGVADSLVTIRGPLADVNAALEGMVYTPNPGFVGTDTLVVTTDDLGNSGTGGPLSDTDQVPITVYDGVPLLDLDADDSSGTGGIDFAASWTEDGGPVAIADVDALLLDFDSANLVSLSIAITNPLDGITERLAADTTGTSITAVYDSGTATLTLSGVDSVARYQQVVRTVTYDNTSQAPSPTSRLVRFVAGDGTSTSPAATASVSIAPQNDAPVAVGDAGVVSEGGSVLIDLAGNDTDADSALDLASLQIVSGPVNGSLVINGDGTVSYTHDGSETTSDSFTYTIRDASGALSNAVAASLVVNPMNDAPVLLGASFFVPENSPAGTVLGVAGAFDADPGDVLSYAITAGNAGGAFSIDPATGMLRVASAAALDFEATPAFSLSVQVTDAGGAVGNATLNVSVGDVPEGTAPPLPIDDPDDVDVEVPSGPQTPSDPPAAAAAAPSSVAPVPATIAMPAWADPARDGLHPFAVVREEQRLDAAARSAIAYELAADAERDEREASAAPQPLDPIFWAGLEQMRREVIGEAGTDRGSASWVVSALETIIFAASSGLVAMLLRGTSLLTLALSSLPLWRHFDPLVVVSLSNEERRRRQREQRAASAKERGVGRVLDETPRHDARDASSPGHSSE